MFQIDLKKSARDQGTATTTTNGTQEVLLGFAPALAALAGLGLVLFWWGGRLDGRIDAEGKDLKRAQVETAIKKQELATLVGRARGVIVDADEQELYWSDILRMLSEKTADKVWLSEIKTISVKPERKPSDSANAPVGPVVRTLRIDAGVLSAAGESNLTEIGEFVKALQEDDRYNRYFGPASLGPVLRPGGETLSMSFSMTATVAPRRRESAKTTPQ